MRIVQRVTAFFLAAVLMTSPFTAMAATSTKISGVSLRIASDIEVGSSGADVSVSTISSKYYVEEVEIKNEPSDEWEDGDKPKIKVTLEAADDYYFASGFSKGDVNLIGNDGTVTSVSRTSSTLVVSITLEALEGESEYDLDVDGLDWDAEDGTAYWNENEEAKKYEIRLYRGSTAVTSVITTTKTSYHFGSYITKGGYYTFQVRGVYNSSNKGSWKESESWYVTSAEAAEISSNSDGETDAEGYTPSVKFNHPGNEQEIREFKTNWLSKKCIVVLRYCSGKPADLIGTPCNPCKLSVSYTGSNESNTNELTFTQISKGDDIAIYRGTDTLEEPVAVVEAGATDIDYQTDGQYQLSAGAAKIAGVTGGSHGSVITLMGCSGVAPTVETGGNFLLKGGKTFTASEGSQLTLRAFNDGSEAMKWIEQSRYEA